MSQLAISSMHSLVAFLGKRLNVNICSTLLLGFATLLSTPSYAITSFQHIVIIFQENRTPDNLFWHLCDNPTSCSTTDGTKFNIKTRKWLTKNQSGQTTTINPMPALLSNCDQDAGKNMTNCWEASHSHASWTTMCDNQGNGCLMDGAAGENCGDNANGAKCQALQNAGQFPFFLRR